MKQVLFHNRDTGEAVAPQVMVADRFLLRARGLLGRRRLADPEGLWIHPCGSVHTCFMRFRIDVIFLDPELRILAQRSDVKPFRVAVGPSGTRSVLELPAGRVAQSACAVGQQLAISAVNGGDHGH
ncbi:MAG: DUF192 domain-containing protein [Desulfosarcinaceae bacterium]|jgi:uncharacterized membrane protein (UPF0127 family)